MKTVTRFQADDGSLWATQGEAEARDTLVRAIADAMAPLGPELRECAGNVDVGNGRGYKRHSPEAIRYAKAGLLAIAKKQLPSYATEHPEWFDADQVDPRGHIIGRILNDGDVTLWNAWARLMCIDGEGREWGQAFFAMNPRETGAVEIK